MLQPETKEYTRTVLARPIGQLPMKKDLPRLAKVIQICDGNGHAVHYKPKIIPETDPEAPPGSECLRLVLLNLTSVLEGEPEARKLEDVIARKTEAAGVYLPEVLNEVLEEMGGDNSRVVKTLKACNQDAIAKPVIELKVKMGMENTTKDVSNSWRIIILVEEDQVHVLNRKRELCVKCRFELEWELTITLERHVMDGMVDAKLMVIDIAFSDELSTSGRQEIRTLLKSYLSDTLTNRKLFLPMLEEWASDEMGQVRKKKNQAPTQDGVLMPGEKILWADPMITFFHHSEVGVASTNGLLFLTNYRLFFQEMGRHEDQFRYELPLTVIAAVVKDKKTGLDIVCNDFRTCRLGFSGKQRKSFTETLQKFKPTVSARLYAFSSFRKVFRTFQDVTDKGGEQERQARWIYGGWRLYDPLLEYTRMKIDWKRWRLTGLANLNFDVCSTYPLVLPVPKEITDYDVKNAAKARRDSRFPVLCWRYQENGAILCRSAGVVSQSKEDEKLVTSIISSCCMPENGASSVTTNSLGHDSAVGVFQRGGSASPLPSKTKRGRSRKPSVVAGDHVGTFYMYDLVNRDGTAQKESQANTQIASDMNALVVSQSLEFVSTKQLLESFKLLTRLCSGSFGNTDDRFLSTLDSTRWLDHIQLLLDNAKQVVEKMRNGHSAMLLGRDGTDRTLQMSSLVAIMLDPYYRTMEGFIVLIEKEWLSFGHKFTERSAVLAPAAATEATEYVPVFLQFIDCVWQLIHQFPCAFEYNSTFLRQVMRHSLYCHYGTFLLSSEAERRRMLLRSFTKSFWLYVAEKRSKFFNGFFTPRLSPIIPETSMRSIGFWSDYYLYWYHYTMRRAGPLKLNQRAQTLEHWSNDTLQRSIVLPKLRPSSSARERAEGLSHYIAQLEKAKELIELELERRPGQLKSASADAEAEEAEEERREAQMARGKMVGPELVQAHKRMRDDDALASFGLPTMALDKVLSILDRDLIAEDDEDDEDEPAFECEPPTLLTPVSGGGSAGVSSPTPAAASPAGKRLTRTKGSTALVSSDGAMAVRTTSASGSGLASSAGASVDMSTIRSPRGAAQRTSSVSERDVVVGELAPPKGGGWGAAVKPVAAKADVTDARLSIGRVGMGLHASQGGGDGATHSRELESSPVRVPSRDASPNNSADATPPPNEQVAFLAAGGFPKRKGTDTPPPPATPPPELFLEDLPPPPYPDESEPLPDVPPPKYAPPPPLNK